MKFAFHQTKSFDRFIRTITFVLVFVQKILSTAMVIAGRSVHQTTLFPGQA